MKTDHDSITTLHDLLTRMELERSAERDDRQITPSAVGTACRRQTAYRVHGAMPTDDVDPVSVATVGTLLHAAVGALWTDEGDTLGVEVPTPGGGHTDVLQGRWYEPDEATPCIVRDLKTVSRAKFDRWAATDPPDDVWQQVTEYATRLGADENWVVVIDALCRETGRCRTYIRDWDPDTAARAANRLDLLDRLTDDNPDEVPADRTGRGDFICDHCPWVTRCTGDDGTTPNPGNPTTAEVVDAAVEYLHWNAVKKEAEARTKAAKAALAGVAEGNYEGYVIRWRDVDETFIEAHTRRGYRVLTVEAE